MHFDTKKILECVGNIERAQSEEAIINEFALFIAQFGFETIALGYLINPASLPPDRNFQVTNWPDDWTDQWRDSDLIIHDPIARYAIRARRPFDWSTAYEHGTKFGKVILDESRNFGFSDGLAIPVPALDGPPGCISLGGNKLDLSPDEKRAVEIVSYHVYARLEKLFGAKPMRQVFELTRRETEVVQYAAAGKTNWEIGEILSISELTVKSHFTSAMRKLDCVNRAQTVAVAIHHSLILP